LLNFIKIYENETNKAEPLCVEGTGVVGLPVSAGGQTSSPEQMGAEEAEEVLV
jgi:hypothetical protein